MDDHSESRYLSILEGVIEELGRVERDFASSSNGIRAVTELIEEMSGDTARFALDDPVVQKGHRALQRVVQNLDEQRYRLGRTRPPALWGAFHSLLLRSLDLQHQGYLEMARLFEDRQLSHLRDGQQLVRKGLGLLQAGRRKDSSTPVGG